MRPPCAALVPLLAALLVAAHATAEPRPAAGAPGLRAGDCATRALDAAGARCFTLRVEEDRDEPNGALVELPVAVLEPETGEPPSEPVFFFPGGPGHSVLGDPDLVAQYRRDVGARTLVLLDHRGMIHARPALRCPGYAEVSPYHRPLFAPAVSGSLDTHERMRSVTEAVEACRAKLEREGVDVAQYSSHAVARDVDELRRALGHGRIDLYGRSTGGGTALAYLKYFPDAVRSVVLVSPWYANLRNRAPLDELHAARQKYTDLLELCVRESRACRERLPGWPLAVERARQALDARPFAAAVAGPDGARRTLYVDGAALLHALYLRLPAVYERMPGLLADVAAGDRDGLGELFRVDDWTPEVRAPGYALGYFLAHLCNDMGAGRPTRAESTRMLEREPALLGFEPLWACAWWGGDGDVPARHAWRPRSAVPVLSLHGQMDPCCGLRWGRHLEATLENLQVVELRGLGHTPDSACGTRLMSGFLADPRAPVDDGCADDVPRRPWRPE